MDWCEANGGTYVHMSDLAQFDGIHETQAGSRIMADHIYRAARASYGAGAGIGPKAVSAVRSGTTITLTLSNVGQGTIVLGGTPGNRIHIFPKGQVGRMGLADNRFPVASVSVVNATTLSIVLANDPGDGHALDLYLYWTNDPANATTDTLRDDRTDGDGIAVGRILQANPVPIAIAAPVPAGTVNAPPSGLVARTSPFNLGLTGAAFAASAGGGSFGSEMTAGIGGATSGQTPIMAPFTVELFFTCPALPGSVECLCGGIGEAGADFIAVNALGRIQTGSVWGASVLTPGKRYHVAYQRGPGGSAVYLTNVTDGGAGARDGFDGTPVAFRPGPSSFGLRNHLGSFALSGGAVDEVAMFAAERYAGASYSAPTAPLDGSEADIVALYHCDGDGADVVAA